MRDNIREHGATTLIVNIGLGKTFSVPVKTTDEAEVVVRQIAAGDPLFPACQTIKGFGIAYTVKHEEYFVLAEGDDDDELPF